METLPSSPATGWKERADKPVQTDEISTQTSKGAAYAAPSVIAEQLANMQLIRLAVIIPTKTNLQTDDRQENTIKETAFFQPDESPLQKPNQNTCRVVVSRRSRRRSSEALED